MKGLFSLPIFEMNGPKTSPFRTAERPVSGFIILSLLFIILILSLLLAGLAPEVYWQIHRAEQRARELREKIRSQAAVFKNFEGLQERQDYLSTLPPHFGIWNTSAEKENGFSDALSSRNKLSSRNRQNGDSVPFPLWRSVLKGSENAESLCQSWQEEEGLSRPFAAEKSCLALLPPTTKDFFFPGNMLLDAPLELTVTNQQSVYILGNLVLKKALKINFEKDGEFILFAVGDIEIDSLDLAAEGQSGLALISLFGHITIVSPPQKVSLCEGALPASEEETALPRLSLASPLERKFGDRTFPGPGHLGCEFLSLKNHWAPSEIVFFGPHKFLSAADSTEDDLQ